ncbi:hypothetical protein H0H92_015962 [Tricholoma furcatifolium]|nr:hypothetical protein H0H92_015962 [Tricholoma furcatifolium]
MAATRPSSPVLSPDSCYSSLPSLSHSSPSSSSSSLHSVSERANEHLAVLLPKSLWKPDSRASKCDNFNCYTVFSVFERRHHCRKCGGVFCATCAARSTPLLDTANLDFIYPPRNIPLSQFATPESPLLPHRVCDACYKQIHGIVPVDDVSPPSTRPTLSRILSSPIHMLKSSPSSPVSSSLASSIDDSSLAASDSILSAAKPISRRKTRSLRNATSSSSLNGTRRATIRTSHLTLPADLERSYGELDSYPLRRCSVICKATGGGRWEPKQDPPIIGLRPPVPGAKAQYEIDMERAESAERIRKANPIVKDGDFQYRFCRDDIDTMAISRSPYSLSTF